MENLTFYLSVLRNNDQTIIVFANHTKVINEERGAVDRLRVISKVQPGVQEAVSKCMTQISQCMSCRYSVVTQPQACQIMALPAHISR